MAAAKLSVLFAFLMYIVKINLVLAQAISGTCSGACAGYGFCGGFYPTVLDTSANTDPLDIILPVLLLAMCKKIGNAGEAPETKSNLNGAVCGIDANGCGGCSTGGGCGGICGSGCCSSYSGCGGGCGNGCGGGCGGGCSGGCGGGCGCGNAGRSVCGGGNSGGSCTENGLSGGCGRCGGLNGLTGGNCGSCVCC